MLVNTTNIFKLSLNSINAIKEKDLISKIKKLKGKVIANNNIKNCCDQVCCLSENIAKLMESNEKLSSQFIIVKKVNTLLEKYITELGKCQRKMEHYSRRKQC